MMKRAILVFGCVLLSWGQAGAQTVVQRERLGHRIEDVDYAASGPYQDHLLILDGYELWGLDSKATDKKKAGFQKLLDLHRALPRVTSGLAWIDSEGVFATSSPIETTTLRIIASDGSPLPSRTIQYLGGYVPEQMEALAYVPASSAVYPNHLILATGSLGGGDARLQVMTTAGQVVKEIIPAAPVGTSDFIGAVSYLASDRIAVTVFVGATNTIWLLDFNGNVVDGPIRIPESDSIEGVAELWDGRVVAVGFFSGKAHFMDAQLARRPLEDQRYQIGPGITLAGLGGLAYDAERERHLVGSVLATPTETIVPRAVYGVPSSLDRADLVTYPPTAGFPRTRGFSYMADEKRLVIAHENVPRALLLYTADGTLAEQIDLTAVGRPRQVAYLSGTQEFAVRVLETNASTIRIVARNGALVRDLDLSTAGIPGVGPMTYFDPSSGGKLLVASGTTIWVVDLNGNVLQSFDAKERLGVLHITGLSTITSGPYAGAFGLTDGSNSELVVFRLE